MQEKNSSNSNSLGICQRLFNIFMNSLIARAIRRAKLGQPLPQGYDHSLRPAMSSGELMVYYKDHEISKHDSGFEIEVLFKQSEETPSPGQKNELPLVGEKIEPQVQGKSTQVVLEPKFTTVTQSRPGPKNMITVKGNEKEDKSKMKGKSIPSANLTLAMEDEEPRRTPRRLRPPLSVAPSINEKSDEFIRSRKEAMRKNIGMEPKKKS